MSTYSQRIKEILYKKGLNIKEFCIKIGMNSPNTIQLIIRENRKPSFKTVNRIITAFPDISYEWLLNGEGKIIKGEKSLSNEEDLTVTAQQIIDRLEFDKGYYDNKLKEDRKHYASERQEMNDESIAKLLIGFEQLEKKVEHYAVAATTRVVKMMMEGLAEQNKMLLEGFKKIQLVESDLEDIKTFMAAKFELQKMKKKKAKQIKKLTPR